jgi:hypothetical protein
MIGLVTFVVYPLIDQLLKEATGNNKAQVRRAGASTFIYNLAMLAKGEKNPEEVLESVVTPAVPLKMGVELALNRDTRTGQRIYDPRAKAGTVAQEVGRRVAQSVAPVDQGLSVAEGRTDWKKLMYSMVGVSFPLHGAEKVASIINAERLAALPPEDEKTLMHQVAKSRALHDAWDGDRTKLDELLKSGTLTKKERKALLKDSLLPPLVHETRSMPYADVLKVYQAATEEQKAVLDPILRKKLANLRKSGKSVPDEE